MAGWGGHKLEALESTWNLGLGFALIVRAEAAAAIAAELVAAGVATWQLGIVESNDCSHEGYVQGAKGVDGGAVRLVGGYKN